MFGKCRINRWGVLGFAKEVSHEFQMEKVTGLGLNWVQYVQYAFGIGKSRLNVFICHHLQAEKCTINIGL